ncbi:hypothetical protein GGX14DRAFT_611921 [Mycena pura]|uniref:Uncharacterized protein n=1 Tax=Mycena pura TaxID=153505 RepID=A0AAD6YSA3_9AGAR|nr:hypothetical protein GGX14DRAFT_611921 [Mycena pura]
MTTTVPLSALATSLEPLDAPLTTKYLYPQKDTSLHRHMEYIWGLNIHTFNPAHERSILHIRKSMVTPFPTGKGSWTLIPTEETLAAMDALQKHNIYAPIYARKSFLAEFSAAQYEYIFIPLRMDVDIFILQSGQAPQRFSAPYSDFPHVTSSANPFFVVFESQQKINRLSNGWSRTYSEVKTLWFGGVLPDAFLLSSSGYPETLISESAGSESDGSEPDVPLNGPESKSGSDETLMTPVDEEEFPSPAAPDKGTFVFDWVRRDANRSRERLIVPPLPPTPRGDRTRRVNLKDTPQWCTETKRGKAHSRRLFAGKTTSANGHSQAVS